VAGSTLTINLKVESKESAAERATQIAGNVIVAGGVANQFVRPNAVTTVTNPVNPAQSGN